MAFVTLGIAILAWAGVGFFAYTIQQLELIHVKNIVETAISGEQNAQASSLHALSLSTEPLRMQLNTLVQVDPASLGGMIQSVGKRVGAGVQITNVVSEGTTAVQGTVITQTFGFNLTAQGSFSTVMRIITLLEAFPVPSSLNRIDLVWVPGSVGAREGLWQMTAHMQVVTASTISS
jgi:hypothetical protein